MAQERINKLVLLLILAVYQCGGWWMESFTLRIDVPYLVRSSLRQHLPFAPREFCRVCSRVFVMTTMLLLLWLLLLPCHRGLNVYLLYDIIFIYFIFSEVLQHTKYKGRVQAAVAETTQCFRALPTGMVDERCDGKRQQAMTKHGLKVHPCQLPAKVKRALLRLPRQCRLNRHLLKTPQPPAVTQTAILSLIAMSTCCNHVADCLVTLHFIGSGC